MKPKPESILKFIYSEKATNFWEISIVDLSHVVTVKSTVEILQSFVAFLENMNFKRVLLLAYYSLSSKVQGLHMLCYIGYWPLNLIFLNGQLGSYWPYTIVCYVVIVLGEIVAKWGGRGNDHSFLLSFSYLHSSYIATKYRHHMTPAGRGGRNLKLIRLKSESLPAGQSILSILIL